MKKKILYGILSIFMCVAMFAGVTFFAGDNLFVAQEQTAEAAATKPTNDDEWRWHTASLETLRGQCSDNGWTVTISTAEQLAAFAYYIGYKTKEGGNIYFSDVDVELAANIDLSSYYWNPIGRFGRPYTGMFNGNGYEIKGLFLNGTAFGGLTGDSQEGRTYTGDLGGYICNIDENSARYSGSTVVNYASGLFGVANNAYIYNFTLSGGHSDLITWGVNKPDNANNYYIGSVLGLGKGYTKVYDVVVSHSIFVEGQGMDQKTDHWYGDTIHNELSDVYIGGIAGRCGYIEDCIVLEKTATWNNPNGTTVSGAGIRFNFTDVMTGGVGDYHVGGVVGVAGNEEGDGSITGCYSYQQISTDSKDPANVKVFYTGGVAGYSHVYLTGCNYYGNMTIWTTLKNTDDWDSSAWYYAGGVVGYCADDGGVLYCFNYGNVTSKTLSCVGGVAGRGNYFSSCGNFGKLDVKGTEGTASKDTIRHCGGIVGLTASNARLYHCVNYGDVYGPSSGVLSFLTQHYRGYGGIVGYAGTNSYMFQCINYGDINSHYSYTGGIVGWTASADSSDDYTDIIACVNIGSVAECKETLLGIDRYIMNSITESGCVSVSKCYYLSGCCKSNDYGVSKGVTTLNSYSFYTTDSNWEVDGYSRSWMISNRTYVSSIGREVSYWMFSNLPTDYLSSKTDATVGNKVRTLNYCLVPNSALSTFRLSALNGLEDLSSAKLTTVLLNDKGDNVELTTTDLFKDWSSVPYLRGINYSYYDNLLIDLSGASEWFFTTNAYVTISTESYDYDSSFTKISKNSIGRNTANEYKIKFKFCPGYDTNPHVYTSFYEGPSVYVEATNRERDLSIQYIDATEDPKSPYTYLTTTSTTYGQVSGITPTHNIGGDEVTSRTKICYGDTIQFDQTPTLGYQFLGIGTDKTWQSVWGNSFNLASYLNLYENYDEDNTKYFLGATTDDSFESRYDYYDKDRNYKVVNLKAPTIYVFYKQVEYSGVISYLDEGSSYLNTLGQLPTSFEKLTISDVLDFIIEQQNGSDSQTTEYSSDGYFSYGYKFTFSVYVENADGEKTDKGVVSEIEPDKSYVDNLHSAEAAADGKYNHKYTKSYDFDDFVEVMDDITLDVFDIVVNRTPISFTMRSHKMADIYNPYNNFVEFVDEYAGSALIKNSDDAEGVSLLSGVKITDTTNIILSVGVNDGFDLLGVYLNNSTGSDQVEVKSWKQDENGNVELNDNNNPTQNVNCVIGKNYIDIKTIVITAYKKGWLSCTDKFLDIYTFMKLQTYSTKGLVVGLDNDLLGDIEEDAEVEKYAVSFTSSQKALDTFIETANLNTLEKSPTEDDPYAGIYYYAPITLQAYDYRDAEYADDLAGYVFAGYYLRHVDNNGILLSEDSLLSTEKKYIYYVDPSNKILNTATDEEESVSEIFIVAKYVKFEATGVAPESSTEVYRDPDTKVDVQRTTYFIKEGAELAWISNRIMQGKDDFENDIIRLTANIDMAEVSMLPIGTEENPFKGIFDGAGYVINNLKLFNVSTDGSAYTLYSNIGLFGVVENAILQDFTLVGGEINGYANVGAVVGKATNTSFDNVNNFSCVVKTEDIVFYDVYGTRHENTTYITSFTDAKHNDINNTYKAATFTIGGAFATQQYVAGVVGLAENCSFTKVSNYADVEYQNHINYVAGLTSKADGNTFKLSFNEGVLTRTEEPDASDTSVIAQFACGTISNAENCYHRETTEMYVYGADLANGSELTGQVVSSTELSSESWLKLYGNYVLRDFYWR